MIRVSRSVITFCKYECLCTDVRFPKKKTDARIVSKYDDGCEMVSRPCRPHIFSL